MDLYDLISFIIPFNGLTLVDSTYVCIKLTPWMSYSQRGDLIWVNFLVFWMNTSDGVQPKTSSFSTCDITWVNCKVASQSFQPIFISFLDLNCAWHISVAELYREPILLNFVIQFYRKFTYSFSLLIFLIFQSCIFLYLFTQRAHNFWPNK